MTGTDVRWTETGSVESGGLRFRYSVIPVWGTDRISLGACDVVKVAFRIGAESGDGEIPRVSVRFNPGFACTVSDWTEFSANPGGGSADGPEIRGMLADPGALHAVILRRATVAGHIARFFDLGKRVLSGDRPPKVLVQVRRVS